MSRTIYRIGQRAMFFHQLGGIGEIIRRLLTFFHHALPEITLFFSTAPKRQNHR